MPQRLLEQLNAEHTQIPRSLDACLDAAGKVDLGRFDEFRRSLLRHLAIEEKVLFPALGKRLGYVPGFQNGLRKDHASIVQLCVPTPNAEWLGNLKELLTWHCSVEESPGGFYDLVDRHCGDDPELVKAAAAIPEPTLPPFQNGPQVRALIKQVMCATGVTTEGLDGKA